MQRHDRRVPVSRLICYRHECCPDLQASFYARYTRDIVNFANRYTGGKVVSVLEGGYGDLALTSAAMGHTIGLLAKEGSDIWLSERELSHVS
jgi:histone deacetylase HOS3